MQIAQDDLRGGISPKKRAASAALPTVFDALLSVLELG
jgi:hypothetical protein